MSTSDAPTDPEQLRAEFEQTRADLGETVQQLAGKADVKARAKQAIGDTTGRAQQKLAAVKSQGTQAASTVAEKVSTAKQQLADSDLPAPVRRPLPLAGIVATAAAVIIVVVVARRRRS
jgi:hypothetical protein